MACNQLFFSWLIFYRPQSCLSLCGPWPNGLLPWHQPYADFKSPPHHPTHANFTFSFQDLFLTVRCIPESPDSRLAPSQWKTWLQSKAVSHWLGTNLESALCTVSSHFNLIIIEKVTCHTPNLSHFLSRSLESFSHTRPLLWFWNSVR